MSIHKQIKENRPFPDKEIIVDVSKIAAVAAALIAIHIVLPESVKAVLAFDHGEFNIWGLYTSALVQNTYEHLFGNIMAYLLAAYIAYCLCIHIGYQSWFRRNFVLLLAVLPPLTVLSSYVLGGMMFPDTVTDERGFSGVASGFVGLLWTTVIIFLGERFDYELGLNFGISLLILLILEVGYAYTGFEDPFLYVLGAAGIMLMLGTLSWQRRQKFHKVTKVDGESVAIVGLATVSLAVLVYGMFPGFVVKDGNIVNVVSHFAGFVWALPIAATTWYLLR